MFIIQKILSTVQKLSKTFIPIIPRALYSFTQLLALLVAKHIFRIDQFYIYSIVFGLSFWVIVGDLGYQLTIQKAFSELGRVDSIAKSVFKNIKNILAINIIIILAIACFLVMLYYKQLSLEHFWVFFVGLLVYTIYSILNIISRLYYFENKVMIFSKKYSLTFITTIAILAFLFFFKITSSVTLFIAIVNAPQIVFCAFEYFAHKKVVDNDPFDEMLCKLFNPESRKQILLSIVAIAAGQLDILILTYYNVEANKLSEYIIYSRIFSVVYTVYSTRLPFITKFFYLTFKLNKLSIYKTVVKRSLYKYSLVNFGVFLLFLLATVSYKYLPIIGITVFNNINLKNSLFILSLLFIFNQLKGLSEIQSSFLGAIFQQKYLIKIVVIQSALSILAQFFLIKNYGIIGVILAMMISFSVVITLQMLKIKNKFNVQ